MDEDESVVEVLGWNTFFQEIEQFVSSLARYDRFVEEAFTEYAIERLEVCIVSVTRLKDMFLPTRWRVLFVPNELEVVETYHRLLSDLVVCLRELLRKWSDQWDMHSRTQPQYEYLPSTDASGRQGRPKFCITRSQLEYLEGMSFNWTQISKMLSVSRTTIYRRRVELSMDTSGFQRSNVTDDELEHLLRQIRIETPALGERMVMGKLRSFGIKVSRSRVRSCIREIDPINTALRWRGHLARRQPYSVAGPNSLWHQGKRYRFCFIM